MRNANIAVQQFIYRIMHVGKPALRKDPFSVAVNASNYVITYRGHEVAAESFFNPPKTPYQEAVASNYQAANQLLALMRAGTCPYWKQKLATIDEQIRQQAAPEEVFVDSISMLG